MTSAAQAGGVNTGDDTEVNDSGSNSETVSNEVSTGGEGEGDGGGSGTGYISTDESVVSTSSNADGDAIQRHTWQIMLHNVLSGDVLRSEKTRISTSLQGADGAGGIAEMTLMEKKNFFAGRIWLEARAYLRGRSVEDEKRYLEEARMGIDKVLEDVMNFKFRDDEEGEGEEGGEGEGAGEGEGEGDGDGDGEEAAKDGEGEGGSENGGGKEKEEVQEEGGGGSSRGQDEGGEWPTLLSRRDFTGC